MSSLRDRLRAYGTQPARPCVQEAPPDCYRVVSRTDRSEYPLADLISAKLINDLSGLELPEDLQLGELLFLDTETTGLSGGAGTLAFLTGLGWFEDGHFIVEQDLMRDYPEEGAMLNRVLELVRRARLLVTFNGRTFDIPLLESRCTMNGIRARLSQVQHLDLLHPARAVFKLRLRRCRLSSLEEAVLDIHREDDLPGSEAPKAWFGYLKTGYFAPLEKVLDHNGQDIRSMPLILARLMEMYQAPLKIAHQEDLFSVGRVLDRRGQTEQARRCYRASDSGVVARLARLRLADSYRRSGDYAASAEVYERMIAEGQAGVDTLVRLAILYEHRLDRCRDALALTRRAIMISNDPEQSAQLERRSRRLQKKIREE